MKTFRDNAGRTWSIAITVDEVKRVRDLLHEDLLDIQYTLARLLVDPILLCDVIFCVVKPQADAEHVSDTDFARGMAGDAIGVAKQALLEELVGFFPSPADRANLEAMLDRYNHLADRARELIKNRLGSTALTAELEAALAGYGGSSGDSPESSA